MFSTTLFVKQFYPKIINHKLYTFLILILFTDILNALQYDNSSFYLHRRKLDTFY